MSPATPNQYAAANRTKKAAALARIILECGGTPDGVASMTAEQWGLAAAAANVKPPGSQETIDEVVGIMRNQISEGSTA